jgi:flagellar biosynthesis/type III secretory pathway protein FliH
MDGSLNFTPSPRNLGALFAEDFDLPEAAPEPEIIEPVFSATELVSERDAAWRKGHAAGLTEAATSDAAAARQAMEGIAAQLQDACGSAAALAEQSADAVARLLLDSLAAAFPVFCACYGEAEVQAIVRSVLPALIQEPVITVRVNTRTAPSLAREIGRLDPDLAARVQIDVSDAMPIGDVRIAWRNGAAARDAGKLWAQVAAILAPAGLLRGDARIKETVDGD